MFQPFIFFLQLETKSRCLEECFHTIKVHGDLYCQAPQKNKNTPYFHYYSPYVWIISETIGFSHFGNPICRHISKRPTWLAKKYPTIPHIDTSHAMNDVRSGVRHLAPPFLEFKVWIQICELQKRSMVLRVVLWRLIVHKKVGMAWGWTRVNSEAEHLHSFTLLFPHGFLRIEQVDANRMWRAWGNGVC